MAKKTTAPNLGLWDSSRSGHEVEIIRHTSAKYEVHCTTCGFRPKTFAVSQDRAEDDERRHHYDIATGVNAVKPRGQSMAASIRHAKDMAVRETTPENERAAWSKLANDMSKRSAPEILDGQIDLFTEQVHTTEGAPS